ncbi:hypothetical protein ACGFX8_24090 [Streptomyces sp. NPDC048362]|uniref:hypothetical protein n=1 Tax=Streptomyces sp. NPDC048362 TaxID=3365539 RepID=UPI003714CF3B
MTKRRTVLAGATAVSAATLLGAAPRAAAADGTGTGTATGTGTPATSSAAQKDARDAIRKVNADMRGNYAALKADLAQRLSPMIVVTNTATGGQFTLVHNGTLETVQPVPEYFELAKSIAHVPLGIYSILAQYLANKVPNVPNAARIDAHDLEMVAARGQADHSWATPLTNFQTTLTTARNKLTAANLPKDLQDSCKFILDEAVHYIDATLHDQAFDIASFDVFSSKVYPRIRTNMVFASQAQISGIEGQLQKWRTKLGDAAWNDLYVVVFSIWTTSVLNQASIIIKRCMNQAKVDSHLIDVPTAEILSDPIAVARDNLARIVQDNVAAEMVFAADAEIATALKGRQDLLSEEILNQLGTNGTADPASYTGIAGATAAGKDACPWHQARKADRISA